jgi:hypothetical protein
LCGIVVGLGFGEVESESARALAATDAMKSYVLAGLVITTHCNFIAARDHPPRNPNADPDALKADLAYLFPDAVIVAVESASSENEKAARK